MGNIVNIEEAKETVEKEKQLIEMSEYEIFMAQFEEVIASVKADIEVMTVFYADLEARYDEAKAGDINTLIKVQSVLVQYRDYLASKRDQLRKLMAQYEEYRITGEIPMDE